MSLVHPGAALYTIAARRAVAEGPLFDRRCDGAMVRASDRRCVIAALDAEDCVFRLIGDEADPSTDAALFDLVDRNDQGEYEGDHGRANLYRDLLGIEVR